MRNDVREPSVYELILKLEDASCDDSVLFGQQNAGHIGVSITRHDGSESDVKNLTGRHPAVVGIDTLAFNGYEGNMEDLVTTVKTLHRDGVIITLSSHMPNFSLGGDKYIDYSPNITEGNVGKRILPGGDLNGKYLRFLDQIALFVSKCIDVSGERIPMIFRPFHECNGSWFWWGRGSRHLSDNNFKTLFRYTIDYLRDEKEIRNLVYCFSPNGQITSCDEYMRRYPGDDYVDLMGMDVYNDRPSDDDGFFEATVRSLGYISECALDHGKTYALTEIGLRTLDAIKGGYYEGLAPSGNHVKDWYTRLLDAMRSDEAGRRCAYLLT